MSRIGLALARSLGRAGVPVTGIAFREAHIGVGSRYVTHRHILTGAPPETRDRQILEAIRGAARTERPALFPDDDDSVDFILRYWDEVTGLAELPLPGDPGVVQALRRKERLPAVAAEAGVPAPATAAIRGERDLRESGLRPPVLIKPVEGKRFEHVFHTKAFVASDLEAAVAGWRRASEHGFETIAQELVPDALDRIFSVFTYVGRDGEPLVSVVGRKLRQLPVPFGSSTAFEVRWEPRALELAAQLLRSAGYRGLAHVEFAYDRRDRSLKLLEVNTRAPIWASVALDGGSLDIARVAFADLSGLRPAAVGAVVTEERYWVDLTRDLVQATRRRDLHPVRFLRPYLRRKKARAVFAADDPAPALSWAVYLGRRAVKSIRFYSSAAA